MTPARHTLAPALLLATLLCATSARAAPDPVAAGGALLATPLRVTGDVLGGSGLLLAATVALVGDGVSLVDDNRITRPLARGALSRSLQGTAFVVAWGATRSMELLRFEEIERLPQPASAYLGAARGAGRLTGMLDGLASLGLGVRDLCLGPVLALLRGAGADSWASGVDRHLDEARIRALGPSPLP